jgi:hypothetical protein
MAFGFSVGDIINVTQIAWSTHTALRDALEDFRGFASEVHSLHTTLTCLLVLSRNGMGFLCDTFPRQLLTVLTVMLSRPDSGRFIVWEKHIDVPTEQVGSNHTAEGRAAFEGL